MNLQGRVVLVTGGARRVGKAIALAAARAGAHVAVHYRSSESEALATADEIRTLGSRAVAIRAELSRLPEIESLMAAALRELGRLDVLVNSASVFYPTAIGATSEAEWNDLLDANLKGPFFLAQLAARAMESSAEGVIINIADVSWESPWPSYLPYCIAKAGLVAMTRGLAKALAPRIRVNAVAPGPVLLPDGMSEPQRERAVRATLLGREGSAEDVASAVRYLIESDYVTGVVLPVDGGRALRGAESPR